MRNHRKAKREEEKRNKFLLKLIRFLEKEFNNISIEPRKNEKPGFEFTHKKGDKLLNIFKNKMIKFANGNNEILIDNEVFPGSSCYIPHFYVDDLKIHKVAICNRQNCFTLSEQVINVSLIDKIKLLFLFNDDFNVILNKLTANQLYLEFYIKESKISVDKKIVNILSKITEDDEIQNSKIERQNARVIKFKINLKDGTQKNGFINISKSSFEVKIK